MNARTLRILFVWGNVTGIGGTERRMAEASMELRQRDHHVTTFIHNTDATSPLATLFTLASNDVVTSPSWRKLKKVWRDYTPDIVITFGIRPSLVTRAFRVLGSKVSVLLMARNGLDFRWPQWLHTADRLTSSWLDLYLTNSVNVREHLLRRGLPAAKIKVLPSAIGKEWKVPLAVRTGRRVVAMVGTDRPEKNHLFGVDVFRMVATDAILRIFTNNAARVRHHLNKLGVSLEQGSRFELIEGQILSPTDFDNIDILLHPSLSESLPRVVLEAQARGCIVIAANVGDTAQYATDGDSVIITGHDPADYVRALSAGLNKPRHLVSSGASKIRDTAQYVDELLEICKTVRDY